MIEERDIVVNYKQLITELVNLIIIVQNYSKIDNPTEEDNVTIIYECKQRFHLLGIMASTILEYMNSIPIKQRNNLIPAHNYSKIREPLNFLLDDLKEDREHMIAIENKDMEYIKHNLLMDIFGMFEMQCEAIRAKSDKLNEIIMDAYYMMKNINLTVRNASIWNFIQQTK